MRITITGARAEGKTHLSDNALFGALVGYGRKFDRTFAIYEGVGNCVAHTAANPAKANIQVLITNDLEEAKEFLAVRK